MRKLIENFVRYPFYANIIIAILLLAGGMSMMSMKKSFFPERKSRFISVSVFYPGASPKEMEEGITMRVEQAIRGLVGIKEITSTSSENFARVSIETTGKYDIDETLMEVKNAVDGISSFPSAAERAIVTKQRSITNAMRLSVSGNVDLLTLKKYAEEIEDDFMASGVMSQVNLSGYPELEISVEVNSEDLMRYGLTIDEISQAIALNNRDISVGTIRSEDEEILIRSRARSADPDAIGGIIIRAKNDGSNLLVRDVATVKIQFSEVPFLSFINGKQAAYIAVNKLAEEDLEAISIYCNNYVDEFNAKHQGIQIDVTFDYLDLLHSRLDLLLNNGLSGLIMVVISLALFLSFRLSLWVAWGIPSAFLAMFVVANLAGVTINMISLFGMILVIGILVDDGIVIGENIYAHFEKGKSPAKAAVDGTMEVLPSVVTSITTTIIAFLPLMFVQGQFEFLYEMAFIVIFSLAFSLMEAFFVLPAHVGSSHVLKQRDGNRQGLRKYTDKAITFLRDKTYGGVLRIIIRWKWIFITLPVVVVFLTVGMFKGGFIQATFFPSIAFDFFSVNVSFTPGSGEKKTLEYLKRFDDVIWDVNDSLMKKHNDTVPYISYSTLTLGNAFSGQENGSHAGNIFIQLRNMEGAPISSFQISAAVKNAIGEVPEADKLTVGGLNRWGSPVSMSLLGKNIEELEHAKEFLMTQMASITGLENINDNNAAGKQEVQLHLKPEAYFLGLNNAIITNQVRQAFYGGQAQRLQQGRDELRVWVRYTKEDRLNLGQMEQMKIQTPAGNFPLSQLADYNIERGPVNIQRYNGQREMRVTADMVDPKAPVPPVLEFIKDTIVPKLQAQYPGVRIIYQGQQKDSQEAGGQLLTYFGIAFSIIILILMIHFRSPFQAIIIILMIPLAIIGAMWGHWIHGIPVSMLSAWGMVALSGVIINDAVVFLAKYNSLLIEGYKVPDAVYEAGMSRFRAIMLTTITTVVGLFPIILEKSVQAQFLIPMAISLAYGVLIGTAFILIFFPVLILVLNEFYVYRNWLWRGGKRPERESVESAIINHLHSID